MWSTESEGRKTNLLYLQVIYSSKLSNAKLDYILKQVKQEGIGISEEEILKLWSEVALQLRAMEYNKVFRPLLALPVWVSVIDFNRVS